MAIDFQKDSNETEKKIKIPDKEDLFPFGQYKGEPYWAVPAKYLDWLIGQSWIGQWPEVEAYIEANIEKIQKQID